MARRPSTTRHPAWSEDMRELFDLAQANWTPPRFVKTTVNAARTRLRVEAAFRRPDGSTVRLIATCVQQRDGSWMGTKEELLVSFRGPVGVAQ